MSQMKTHRLAISLLVSLISGLSPSPLVAKSTSASAGPETGPVTDFQNWRVGCDNVRTCRAYSHPSDEEMMRLAYPDYSATLVLDRSGQPNARPSFRVQQDSGHAVSIEWDQRRKNLPLKPVDDQPLDGEATAQLLQALRTQNSLSMVDRNHHILGTISLAGASAALLWMDEKQHRVNTVTALVKPGIVAAAAIAVPSSLPIIHATKLSQKPAATFGRDMTARLIGRENLCTDKQRSSDQTEFHRLDGKYSVAIVTIGCPLSFNNEGAIYIVTDDERSTPKEAKIDSSDDIQWMWYDDCHCLAEGADNHGANDENLQDQFVWNGYAFVHSQSHTIFKGGEIITYRSVVVRDRQ